MSKETPLEEISVQTSDIGVLLVTEKLKETSDLFHSVDEAISSKDLESHLKKGLGSVLVGIGIPVIVGSWATFVKNTVDNNEFGSAYSLVLSFSGIFLSYSGALIYESGSLARRQWNKLKEFLNQASQSVAEQSEPTTSES